MQTVIQVIGGQDGGYHRDREWRAVNDTEHRQYRLSEIIVLQAGQAAVDRLCKRKLPYADWEAGSDHKLALKRAMWLSNNDEQGRTAITSMGRRRAEVLVEKRWGQTHKLAFHLLDSFGGRIRSISRRGMAAIFG